MAVGYLVELIEEGIAYRGVDRIPPYPGTLDMEVEALEQYVFGPFKDEATNLILTYEKALQLLQMFATSPRQFEIIACDTEASNTAIPNATEFLGYDVAGIRGDGWSIVGDFCASDWAKEFWQRLNNYGLFESRQEAISYLTLYKQHQEADYESDFDIVAVWSTAKPNAV